MYKKLLILCLLLLSGIIFFSSVAFADDEPLNPSKPSYWLIGQVKDADTDQLINKSLTVQFYKLDANGNPVNGQMVEKVINNGEFMINAYELHFFKGVELVFSDDYRMMAIDPENVYAPTAADTDPFSLDAENGFVQFININMAQAVVIVQGGTVAGTVTDANGDPIEGAGVQIVGMGFQALTDVNGEYSIGGILPGDYSVSCAKVGYQGETKPLIHISNEQETILNFMLLQGIAGPQVGVTVLLQGFYNGTTQKQTDILVEARQVPVGMDDLPQNATELVGSTVITLNQNDNTTGTNGFGDAFPEGEYYLVIKHLKENVSIHLPIISSQKVTIQEQNPVTYDFSADINNAYKPANKTWDPLFSKFGKYLMWVGDLDGNKVVNEGDYTLWVQKLLNDNQSSLADMDGNGMVNEGDYTLWVESINRIGLENGLHSYIP